MTAASETLPTAMVLVSRIGVSSRPHSCDLGQARHLAGAVEHEAAGEQPLAKTSSWGMIAVTPVRTGPLPTLERPSPEMSVVWPTRTPATSVIAL